MQDINLMLMELQGCRGRRASGSEVIEHETRTLCRQHAQSTSVGSDLVNVRASVAWFGMDMSRMRDPARASGQHVGTQGCSVPTLNVTQPSAYSWRLRSDCTTTF